MDRYQVGNQYGLDQYEETKAAAFARARRLAQRDGGTAWVYDRMARYLGPLEWEVDAAGNARVVRRRTDRPIPLHERTD